MQQIRPVSDLRTKFSEIDHTVIEEHSPVILTKNGYGHMVLMSYEEYGRLTATHELYRLIDRGLDDIEHGRSKEFNTAMHELRQDIVNGKL